MNLTQIMWIVEHLKLIVVGVSVELSRHCTLITSYDLVEVPGPNF